MKNRSSNNKLRSCNNGGFLSYAFPRWRTCQWCGKRVYLLTRQGNKHNTATADHIIPSCLGGSDSWSNLVIACWECNQKKGYNLSDKPILGPKWQDMRMDTTPEVRVVVPDVYQVWIRIAKGPRGFPWKVVFGGTYLECKNKQDKQEERYEGREGFECVVLINGESPIQEIAS